MTFSELISDKRVALVGPAKYMMGSNLGKEIDQYDVVVRINRSYESVEERSKDIGSRTDILYSCLIEKPANAGELNLEIFLKKGIKHICAPPSSNMKGLSSETRLHDLVDVEKVRAINEKIPVRIIDHQFHTHLAQMVDCRPNTGFLAIYDLMRFSPKKLKVFGFSFYLDGFIEGVKEGVHKELGLTPEEFSNKCFVSKRHVQKNMWEFAKRTLLDESIVEVDPVLDDILRLESLDKKMMKFRW